MSDPSDLNRQRPREKAAQSADRSARAERALIRKTLATAQTVRTISDRTRRLLAGVLGSKAGDLSTITYDLMVADSAKFAAISQLLEVASMDAMEAGVTAAAANRNDLKAMWALLEALGAVEGAMPAVDVKAALAVAKAAVELEPADLGELERLSELLKS